MHKFAGHKLLVSMGILGVTYVAFGVVIYLGMQAFTRWYLQRLYGRHLDRLEASLHELA